MELLYNRAQALMAEEMPAFMQAITISSCRRRLTAEAWREDLFPLNLAAWQNPPGLLGISCLNIWSNI